MKTPRDKHRKACWTSVAGAVPVRCAAKVPRPKKARNRLRPRSAAAQRRMALYRPVRGAYLWSHPRCECVTDGKPCGAPVSDVHHRHGRLGDLLFYAPLWVAVCRVCHARIGDDRGGARANGMLAQDGDWNRMPDGVECQPFRVCVPDREKTRAVKFVDILVPCRWDEDLHDWMMTVDAHDTIDMVKRHQMETCEE